MWRCWNQRFSDHCPERLESESSKGVSSFRLLWEFLSEDFIPTNLSEGTKWLFCASQTSTLYIRLFFFFPVLWGPIHFPNLIWGILRVEMVSHISVSRSTALGTYKAVYKWSLISGLMSSAPTVHRKAQYEESFTLERRDPKSGSMSVSLFPFLLKLNDASSGYLTIPSVGLWWVKAHREIGTVSDIEQAFMKCHLISPSSASPLMN